MASKYVEKQGFRILKRNYQKTWGELDIVATKDGILHFFEVKSILCPLDRVLQYRPEENVHTFKVGQIRRMIETYFLEFRVSPDQSFSFHVLSVYIDMCHRRARIKWLKDIIL